MKRSCKDWLTIGALRALKFWLYCRLKPASMPGIL